jgi:hypothetical protein
MEGRLRGCAQWDLPQRRGTEATTERGIPMASMNRYNDHNPNNQLTQREQRERARAQQRHLQDVYDDVELEDTMDAGSHALASRIMQRTVELNQLRRELAGQDELVNMLLVDIQETTHQQSRARQRNLYSKPRRR